MTGDNGEEQRVQAAVRWHRWEMDAFWAEKAISIVLADPQVQRVRAQIQEAETRFGLELRARLQPFQDRYDQAVRDVVTVQKGPEVQCGCWARKGCRRLTRRRRARTVRRVRRRFDFCHVLEPHPPQMGLYTRTVQIAMDAVRASAGPERSGLALRLLAHLRQVRSSPLRLKVGTAVSGAPAHR
ncbi:hypothetical protein [Streptomyces botrytidirepellens]|uniref:Uncharacterized protein n=1 Tax=Streptomyces botrytidirepellens TaxID=2486417 RepID=A0A3M8WNW5_9ACTN|nr:hypothetical protein [Streptomyces botrytidirepellens]RNG30451.1 hypothetical protein EEJ42_10500 [Streptomyces botrytidirepellens]